MPSSSSRLFGEKVDKADELSQTDGKTYYSTILSCTCGRFTGTMMQGRENHGARSHSCWLFSERIVVLVSISIADCKL